MSRFSRFFTLLSAATFSLTAWGQAPDYVEMMNDPSVNFYDVVDAFNTHWEGKSIEKGRGWKQFKRWEAFMEPRVYPSGTRPAPQSLYQGYLAGVQGTATASAGGLGNWNIVGPFNGNLPQWNRPSQCHCPSIQRKPTLCSRAPRPEDFGSLPTTASHGAPTPTCCPIWAYRPF